MHTRTTAAAAASSLGQEMSRIDSRTKRRFPQGKCHSVEKCEKSERRRKNGAEQKIRTERERCSSIPPSLLPDDYREVWRMEDNFVINEIRNSRLGGGER